MHWADINERGSLAGMHTVLWIQRRLGVWPLRVTLWLVIFWYFVLHRTAREASRNFLLHIDPTLGSRPVAMHLRMYRHVLSFGETLLDKLAAWSGQIDEHRLCGEGRENFEIALESGRGGIVLVAHHGNLDVINALAENHPHLSLVVLMHTRNADKFNRVIEQASQRKRPHIIETTEVDPSTAQLLSSLLSRGGFVIIAADRVPLNSSRFQMVEFLGEMAPFPHGPFVLATLLRCPVYIASCVKQAQQFQIDFELLGDTTELRRRDRQLWIEKTTRLYVEQLEKRVRETPLQWFNFFLFWRISAVQKHAHD